MPENINYKALYETVKNENIKLTEELNEYKMRFIRKSSYGEDMELIVKSLNRVKKHNKANK